MTSTPVPAWPQAASQQAASKQAAQNPLRAVAENIYQLRQPLPFALNHVNCYLLRDGGSGGG